MRAYWTSCKAIAAFQITMPTPGISFADVTNVRQKGGFAHQSKVAPLEAMGRWLQLSLWALIISGIAFWLYWVVRLILSQMRADDGPKLNSCAN